MPWEDCTRGWGNHDSCALYDSGLGAADIQADDRLGGIGASRLAILHAPVS